MAMSKKTSKIMLSSDILGPLGPPQENRVALSNCFEEKIAKNEKPKGNASPELEIVLWSKDRSRKLLNFVCSAGMKKNLRQKNENRLENLLKTKNACKEIKKRHLGNVNIKIFETNNGEKSFEFCFETLESSTVKTRARGEAEEFVWKGGKDALDFKINLNPLPTKSAENMNFGFPGTGKENCPGGLPTPDTHPSPTPAPQCTSFLTIFRGNLNF